jgi:hypothetical protein
MLIDRGIKLALLVSLAWHIFCIKAFSVTFPEARLEKRNFAAVSFLGQFLDSNFLASPDAIIVPPSAKENKDGTRSRNVLVADAFTDETDLGELRDVLFKRETPVEKQTFLSEHRGLSHFYEKGPLLAQLVSRPLELGSRSIKKDKQYARIDRQMESRGIIFKPSAFWLLEAGKDRGKAVELRVLVSSEGRVIFLEKESSCGDPEIDSSFIRYIRRWHFTPLEILPAQAQKEPAAGGTHDNQWSKIRFGFWTPLE